MSMYKQLWLAIIISMLLALTGSLLASMLSARSYLEDQLSIKNSDNANALALSLSQQAVDPVIVELAVASLYDSGYYEAIEVTDPAGNILVSRVTAQPRLPVPQWFTRLLPIEAQQGTALITSGWAQFGRVTLRSNSSFAYLALWRSALVMSLATLLAGLVGGFLGGRILRRLRRPLQAVIDQAQAITDRRFVTIAEPAVPELSRLAAAMNSMVGRLKAMFDEEARKLEVVRLEANTDPLTGLANRSFVLARLRALLDGDDATGCALLLIRIADLAGLNRDHGREATDELLRRVGGVLQASLQHKGEGSGGRLNGADFAVVLARQEQVREFAAALQDKLVQTAAQTLGVNVVVCIGLGTFPRGAELSSVLAQTDLALAAAESHGGNTRREAVMSAEVTAKSADTWTRLLNAALAAQRLRLGSFPVLAIKGGVMHHECPLRLQLEAEGEWLPAGHFLPMAERLQLTARLDRAAVRLGLQVLAGADAMPGVAVNLSGASLADPDFLPDLKMLLEARPRDARRLWLEVPEAGALLHFDAFRQLVDIVKATGARIGVEHFGRQFSQVGSFHQLGLDYFKVDASFVREVNNNPGNQSFLKGLTFIAKGIGVLVIAEGVASAAELETLQQLGFDGATGPAIR